MTNIDPRQLVSRYVAVWNEPDAELRRKAIHQPWTKDGAHIVKPPQEIRKPPLGWASLPSRSKPTGTTSSKRG